jgi:hypothetical protein
MDHGVCHVLEIEKGIYSLCPKKNVILGILGQIIKEVIYHIMCANWLLHAYIHMHTCQIK